MTYTELLDFVNHRMRMSHVYQPVMLMTLIEHGGDCSEEAIARALLSHDVSQVEYYEAVTRNMVGRVLRSHGIVERDSTTKRYRLTGFEHLSQAHIDTLVAACQRKLDAFVEARGDQPWSHRKKSASYVSGTLRYEVLKAAKFRCELCGISADEKALEVDHIIPRNQGGTDDPVNLQALCYSHNAMKRDRDATDFRAVRRSYDHREVGCPFCDLSSLDLVEENALAFAIRDRYPVTDGHTLVIPKRHAASLFDLGRPEVTACMTLLQNVKINLSSEDARIQGVNVGVNDGAVAGQTVFHCHWHLIPRREGDVPEARGGIRNTIPGKAAY